MRYRKQRSCCGMDFNIFLRERVDHISKFFRFEPECGNPLDLLVIRLYSSSDHRRGR
ncbi:MAG: hypothetical protein QY317_03050 [Candidatus Jettenia caeni]|nr:MAG: hypothetical protein QY317_03050 [Candidatus Jettenia caeni]